AHALRCPGDGTRRVCGMADLAAGARAGCAGLPHPASGTRSVNAAPEEPVGIPGDDAALARLHRIWSNRRGIVGQLAAVNHGTIAMRFIVTGFAFFLVGGILSMFIRLQLAWFGAEVL